MKVKFFSVHKNQQTNHQFFLEYVHSNNINTLGVGSTDKQIIMCCIHIHTDIDS